MKPIVSWSLKAAGSVLFLGLTFWILPTGEIWNTARSIPLYLWLIGFGVFLLGHIVCALKWWLLVDGDGEIPFSEALRAHFAGLAANLCLPGVAGGDIVRAGLIMRRPMNKAGVAAASLVDRLLDAVGLLALASVGGIFVFQSYDWAQGPLFRLGLGLGIVGLVLLLSIFAVSRIPRVGFWGKLLDAGARFRERPGRLASCLALSMFVQSVFVSVNIQLAVASGIDVPAGGWFFAWPLAKLLAIAPVSLAGLGVREAGLAALLAPLGGPPAGIVGVSLLWQSILFSAGMLGGIAFLVSRRSAAFPTGHSVAGAEGES